ncbi:MAG TPA: hypothetical protein V6D25_18760 [Leptolyngbyaceae cyanobacterium]
MWEEKTTALFEKYEKKGVFMGVAWITDIYQYSGRPVFMRSRDDQHNGIVNGQDFNDREWHIIPQGIHRTSYFAIPWFYLSESHHYKIISFYEQVLETPDNIGGIRLYTSVYNGQDSIYYVDQMGKTFARTALANGTDTNCKLVFPLEGGFYIDPINSGNPDPHTILNEAGQVVKTTIIELCQVTQAVASVAPLFG